MYTISFHIRWCKSYPCAGLDRVQVLGISKQSAQESGISCYGYYNNIKNKNKKKRPSEKHLENKTSRNYRK
jgi:hypothetical protein